MSSKTTGIVVGVVLVALIGYYMINASAKVAEGLKPKSIDDLMTTLGANER